MIPVRTEGQRTSRIDLKFRAPNWDYVPGSYTDGSAIETDGVWAPPTRMPEFIGCAEFGSLGAKERSNCTVLVVPDDVQGASKALVDELVKAARRGVFPVQPTTTKDKCVFLPISIKISYCRNSSVQVFEAVQVFPNLFYPI